MTVVNHALTANGSTATASSTAGTGFEAFYAIDDDTGGPYGSPLLRTWGSSGVPATLTVTFDGPHVVSQAVVYSWNASSSYGSTAYNTNTGSDNSPRDFTIELRIGGTWTQVASKTGNTQAAIDPFNFAAVTATAARIIITQTIAADMPATVCEFQLWGDDTAGAPPPAPPPPVVGRAWSHIPLGT